MFKKSLLVFLLFIPFSNPQPDTSIIFSEVMFTPTSGNNEFIELYNLSNTESIDLAGFKIKYYTSTPDQIVDAGFGTILKPNSFAVIFEGDYDISTGIYSGLVPASALILKISDNAFGSTGMANTTSRPLWLLNAANDTIDYYFYSANNPTGISDEKIILNRDSLPTNWANSVVLNGTPGFTNSVTPLNFDLQLNSISFFPSVPVLGDDVTITVKVKNNGLSTANNFTLEIYNDLNFNATPDNDELLFFQSYQSLVPNDSLIIPFTLSSVSSLNYQIIAKVIFDSDQNLNNNSLIESFNVLPFVNNYNDIVINEIMYMPSGGEPEWIEIFNKTEHEVNLKNWSISDILTTPTSITIKNDFIIPSKQYAVISKDNSILTYHRFISSNILVLNFATLNNDKDGVVLKDNRGVVVDSVFYSNQWGGTNGFSLERISTSVNSNNQYNWASSKDIEQSTPGRINSITPKEFDLAVVEITFSPKFPTNGDDVLITAKIKNNGGVSATNFTTEFYIDSDSNNIVDKLISLVNSDNLNSGDSVSISSTTPIFSLQRKILVGVKVIYHSDEDTLNNYFEKFIEPGFPSNIIKINEVMYNPADGKPEWVEFINASSDSIEIKNWLISDVLPTPTKNFVTNQNISIAPDEIFIVAKDLSFNSAYPETKSKVFYSNFGTLGNTTDGVIIYDFRNGIIDSLFYRSSWGGKKGFSLERISLNKPTNDSTNWVTSLDISGSTPGRQNSIFDIPVYDRNALVINEIMYNPEVGNGEFVEFYNLTYDTVNIGGWKFEDENKNTNKLIETSFLLPPKEYFVLCSDSTVIKRFNLYDHQYKNILGTSSLGLANSGELILLKDARGNVVDSVFYSDKWNNKNIETTKGKSLERINPTFNGNDPLNWSTAVNALGGTPGKPNSIFTENPNQLASITINPNPFSPDNDGFEDFTVINYNLTQPIAQIRVKIFDSKGRLLRTLSNNQASGSSGSVVFDGLDDDGHVLRMGIYIIFLEALNDNSGIVETTKSVVVVARKL